MAPLKHPVSAVAADAPPRWKPTSPRFPPEMVANVAPDRYVKHMRTAWPMKIILLAVLLAAGVCRADIEIPPGFELQKLDTTQGRIAKPKGWFYSHFSDKFSLKWILAKEDPKAGPYQTGFRIQFVPDATRAAKVPPDQFVDRFIVQKQQSAEVKRLCPAVQVGQFMRRCLETIEGPHRILYSLFWSHELDAIVITIFGAPVTEWEQSRHIADRMNEFELLGADFWKK